MKVLETVHDFVTSEDNFGLFGEIALMSGIASRALEIAGHPGMSKAAMAVATAAAGVMVAQVLPDQSNEPALMRPLRPVQQPYAIPLPSLAYQNY